MNKSVDDGTGEQVRFRAIRSFKILPKDQLVEVFSDSKEKARDVFVGGIVDSGTGTLALVRGDLEQLAVPLSMFRPSGTTSPNFQRFELGDYGHTLRFGEYEATADVVLWETDPEYRKRAKAKELYGERADLNFPDETNAV
jgi:hypothetical protein